jgi:hypothetical protein
MADEYDYIAKKAGLTRADIERFVEERRKDDKKITVK